jgi:ribosomal protein S18 acetylase RimI-like enzyme
MSRVIRVPDASELEQLRDIERAAGALFVDVGMPGIAADEPFTVEELTAYLDEGHIWVAVENATPVGYALIDIVDGNAHLEQLSVDPEQGRRGHGAALLAHVCAWAGDNGHDAVTLTTFEHVEWNAPYYARHGFRVMAEAELGPGLRQLRDEETRHGLDPTLRVVMRKDVRA